MILARRLPLSRSWRDDEWSRRRPVSQYLSGDAGRKVLKKGGVTVKLIPTPREYSSDCGMAVRFNVQDMDAVRVLLEQARVEVAGIHTM